MAKKKDKDKAYWSATLKLLTIILTVWAIVSFLLSIIFVESLNTIKLGGYPLGFWFAQQGSIYIFIALIFIRVFANNIIGLQLLCNLSRNDSYVPLN